LNGYLVYPVTKVSPNSPRSVF